METYVEMLEKYLEGRRNIKRKLYKIMNGAYRAVQNGRTTWDDIIALTGGVANANN